MVNSKLKKSVVISSIAVSTILSGVITYGMPLFGGVLETSNPIIGAPKATFHINTPSNYSNINASLKATKSGFTEERSNGSWAKGGSYSLSVKGPSALASGTTFKGWFGCYDKNGSYKSDTKSKSY